MANALITPSIIAKEALFQLKNYLAMGRAVHREYKDEFVKVGGTVNIRRPVKFLATDGATLSIQDVEEANLPVTISSQKHVAWEFSSQDLTLTVEQYSERYVVPAVIALANKVDTDGLALFPKFYQSVNVAAFALPTTFAHVALASRRLDDMAVPPSGNVRGERKLVGAPAFYWSLAGAQTALFHEQMVRQAWQRGDLTDVGDLQIMRDQNTAVHTRIATEGTPLVDGAAQNVTYAAAKNTWTQTLITDGWTASMSITAGTVFTIANVFMVNPVNKLSTGILQQFSVQTAVTANASPLADTNLTISPPIITSGPYQTVNSVPADDAVITVNGVAGTNYVQNLAFHRNAMALVTVPMVLPDGASFKARATDKDVGLSIRVIKDYDMVNDRDRIRLDILYGWAVVYPEVGLRFWTVQ